MPNWDFILPSLAKGTFKILEQSPKGFRNWKSKFFYVKEVAVVCRMSIQSVFQNILTEKLTLPTAEAREWYEELQAIPLVSMTNKGLQALRMMLRRKLVTPIYIT
ncbi:hypothetical protein Hanom_Chr03g00265471 [Helianthus anomalus]